ncbi:MAG: radical SAM protein, partial [Lachnospiraceae bacterium]|nr:radical SAM protein [Lachnospiraceae bacterium]
LLRFIRLINHEKGANLSERHITVSTCGLVPKIRELAQERLQITLALSLHAPTQEKRRELMPVANKYELNETLDALRFYFEKTHRRVSFEYSLVSGKNDSDEDAYELGRLLYDFPGHINLIPVNTVDGKPFTPSQRDRIAAFKQILEKKSINVTIRRSMGRDIDGACGQLRRRTNAILRQDRSGESAWS